MFSASLLICALFIFAYFIYKRMAKAGNPFFQLGYMLYTKTPIGHVYYRREVAKAQQKYNHEPHSVTAPQTFNDVQIYPIPMSMDNYSYLITDHSSKMSVLVDPADPAPVQAVIDKEGITPSAILTTHKHWDHSDGNKDFRKKFRGIQVFGGKMDSVPGVTNLVVEGEVLQFGNLKFTVYDTPGHTVGHVVYLLEGSPPHLFSGDHLFFAGIGRMFEGSPSTMLASLDKICTLDENSLVWPGHEYAVDNMEYALTIDASNQFLQEKYQWAKEKRKNKEITSPSTLADEKKYNPFLRTSDPAIQKELNIERKEGEELDQFRARCLAQLRVNKDQFKYKL